MNCMKPGPNVSAVLVTLSLLLGVSVGQVSEVEVDAGPDQVVAMNDLAAPNILVDRSLLDPTHPSWPFPFATCPDSPIQPRPVTVRLNGSHTADAGTPVTITWSVADANQAAHVTIENANVLDPNVTFDDPNLYSLTLAVDDGAAVVTDTVTIKVKLVANALQAHWKFDGDPNDPNDYDWNYTGFAGTPDFAPGLVGDALVLKRKDSITYGKAIGAETSISVAFWMKPAGDFAADSSQGLIRKQSGVTSDPQGGWTFQLRSETELRWRCSSGYDNGAGDLKVVNAYPKDKWSHIVGTYDGSTRAMKFYLNGQLAGERTASDTCFDAFLDEMTVGSNSWAGMIDDLYVFDYPLNTDEIRPLVAKGLNVAPSVRVQPDQAKIVMPDKEVDVTANVVEEGPYGLPGPWWRNRPGLT